MPPLGMGSTGRKLVSATSLAANSKDISKELAPFQLSYAVKNGCEAVVHLLRQMHELNGATHVIITLDVSNAFNSVSRLQGLLSIAQSLPGVYTYANCTYRRNNTLWLESQEEQTREPIQGQEGSTQGAVDGGLFFNTAMNHVLKETNAVLAPGSDGAMVAIADDIVGCVIPQMARQVLDIVVQRFHSLHLRLNYEKCHIFADTPELLRRVDLSGNPNLASIKTTHEGVIVLGAAISKLADFHIEHIHSVIREAAPALQAITAFSKDHLQQSLAFLRATYMSKFAYLTRVTPPHIVSPHLRDIMLAVREALGEALDHELLDNQWGQCLLKPRLGGLGIVDVVSTAAGAYYASILACLPIIAKVDEAQSIGLNCTQFTSDGLPHNSNTFRRIIVDLHEDRTRVYDGAMEVDRDLSLQVLGSLPEEPAPTPGAITPPDREERVNSVKALAAIPMPTPKDLMLRAKKLQLFFSDKTSRIARHNLLKTLPPDDVIRIHSASDEGAAIIQARPTSPNTCFRSLDFKVLLYLRLGIPIATADVNCSFCASAQLSNRHLVNGCPHKNYKHRKQKSIMTEIFNMCTAADILVA